MSVAWRLSVQTTQQVTTKPRGCKANSYWVARGVVYLATTLPRNSEDVRHIAYWVASSEGCVQYLQHA